MTNKLDIAKASLRILCAILLVFAGLAHRPAAARSLPPAGLAVYVLPDGSVSELCLPGEDGKTGKVGWFGCEVCRLALATILPAPPADGLVVERLEEAMAFPSVNRRDNRLPLRWGASPRGPPAFFA